MVVGEHSQLPLDQGLHVFDDLGEVVWRDGGIEPPIALGVLLELLPPVFR